MVLVVGSVGWERIRGEEKGCVWEISVIDAQTRELNRYSLYNDETANAFIVGCHTALSILRDHCGSFVVRRWLVKRYWPSSVRQSGSDDAFLERHASTSR